VRDIAWSQGGRVALTTPALHTAHVPLQKAQLGTSAQLRSLHCNAGLLHSPL
jgi:hypothetical protein